MFVFLGLLDCSCDEGGSEDAREGVSKVGDTGLGEYGFLGECDNDLVFLGLDAYLCVLVVMGVEGWSVSPPGGLLDAEVAAVKRWVCSKGMDRSFWVKSSDFIGTVAGFVEMQDCLYEKRNDISLSKRYTQTTTQRKTGTRIFNKLFIC